MLTQKDLYDYIEKNGVDAFDTMANELAKNVNAAKAKYEANQKIKKEKAALVEKRNDAFANLFHEFWAPEDIHPLGYDTLAKTVCEAVDNFAKKRDELMKHAKNVDVKTEKIPGGTKTTITGNFDMSNAEAKKAIDKILDELEQTFSW